MRWNSFSFCVILSAKAAIFGFRSRSTCWKAPVLSEEL
jgi:hypothetical protein